MSSAIHDAIVIGCGIGGPAVAMALQQAGIPAAVYEAYDRPAEYVGSFLNLSSNGIDALRAIGADAPVLERAFPTARMVMWSGSGKRLGEVANGLALSDGTTSQTIERWQLHRTLRDEALRRGIAIVGGRRLASIARRGDRVIAAFEDGSEAAGSILIGADGLHSRVRQIIDPAAPAPRDSGQLSIGGRARACGVPPTPDSFHMIFGTRAFFGYTVRPSGDVYWFANLRTADAPGDATARTASRWIECLEALFADDIGPALRILAHSDDRVAAYPIFDLPTLPRWRHGRLVLIGDAAHTTSPSSGQGASLAIEDAVVLARCLRDIADPAAAFAAYERSRRPRVERVVAYSARIGQTKIAGPVGRWFRDRMMPFALRHFASPDRQAWLYQHHIDWQERAAAS